VLIYVGSNHSFYQFSIQVAGGRHRDPDDGKPDRSAPFSQRAVLGGRGRKRAALLCPDRLQRRPESFGGTRLHLDDDELVPAPADQIDLSAPGDKPGAYDLIAAGTKQARGRPFASLS